MKRHIEKPTFLFTHVASFNRHKQGGRIRIGWTVNLHRARRATALVGLLVLVTGGLTPSICEADSGKGAGTSKHDGVEAVRQTTTFGTLGIVTGQTVRLSAVRAGNDDAAAQCKVELNFFNAQGERQGDGESADLQPSQAAFFDLSRADIHPDTGDPRAQIYAVVVVSSEAKKDGPTVHVAMSIEIIDELDGRTQIYQGAFTSLATSFRLNAKIQNCCTVCCRAVGDRCTDERSSCVDFGQTPICPKCT